MANNIGAATVDDVFQNVETERKAGLKPTVDRAEALRVTLNKQSKAQGRGKEFYQDR